jgi:hypothetical protein
MEGTGGQPPAHRLDGVDPGAGVGEHVAGVLAALVRNGTRTADLPAAHRRSHAGGGPGQRGVVMLSYGEAAQTPRSISNRTLLGVFMIRPRS